MSCGKGLHRLFESDKINSMTTEEKPRFKLPIDTWPVICCGTVLSAVFFIFGVDQLIGAYRTTNPYLFLMLFFSSSMILLVNGTIFFILVVMGFRRLSQYNQPENKQESPTTDGNDTKPL